MTSDRGVATHPAVDALRRDLFWYDKRARTSMIWYRALKLIQVLAAAAVAVSAGLAAPHAIPAVLGAGIVSLESVQQLFHFHDSWLSYRSTWQALHAEMRIFEAGAGQYQRADDREMLLAKRHNELISAEGARWASIQQDAPDKQRAA